MIVNNPQLEELEHESGLLSKLISTVLSPLRNTSAHNNRKTKKHPS